MGNIRFENVYKKYEDSYVIEDLNLNIENGERLILLGPSGCGKSTVLRMIAGLEKISQGNLYFDNQLVNDVPPGERNIAMVFQNYALFPHMTVEENINYALRAHKVDKKEIRRKVDLSMEILGLQDYKTRKPRELSGGQRQRVALARALVKESDIFLLDEPLSNLDALLRVHARKELLEIHRRFKQTFVYVTHDQIEAMTLGDRIALLYQGKIQMLGTPKILYHCPVNIFVASFIGTPPMNLVPVFYREGNLELEEIRIPLPKYWQEWIEKKGVQDLILGIRPERLLDYQKEDLLVLDFTVDYVESYGAQEGVHFFIGKKSWILLTDKKVQEGNSIKVSLNPLFYHFFDAETQENIGYPEIIEKFRKDENYS